MTRVRLGKQRVSKLSVLDTILQPNLYPDLYGNMHHMVRINYYPPPPAVMQKEVGMISISSAGWAVKCR